MYKRSNLIKQRRLRSLIPTKQLQNFLLLFLVVTFTLIIMEIFLRRDTHENAIVVLERVDNLSLKHLDEVVEINKSLQIVRSPHEKLRYVPGLRVKDGVILFHPDFRTLYNVSKDSNTFRIIVLGDSLSYGLGVDKNETYSYFLEGILNQNSGAGSNFEVLNFAVPGYDIIQIRMLLEELVFDFDPDLVIYSFYQNDVSTQDIIKKEQDRMEVIYSEKTIPYLITLPFNAFMLEHLRIYRFLNTNLITILEKLDVKPTIKYYYLSHETAKSNLNRIISSGDKRRVPLLIIDLPDIAENYNTAGFIEATTKEEGIEFFNIGDKLATYDPKDIRLQKSSYFNAKGHQIVANLILEYLLNETFLPPNSFMRRDGARTLGSGSWRMP